MSIRAAQGVPSLLPATTKASLAMPTWRTRELRSCVRLSQGLQCKGAPNLLPATIVIEDFARVGDGIVKNLRR
jgi:hypothetical protein